MNFLSLIESKRAGGTFTQAQIKEFILDYVAGRIPDYQMAAMLMAIFFRGLSATETTMLTLAMRDSGETLKFPKDKRPLVDKHSTGGVGDKVSLVLVPLLACLGFRVPMISGRGLDITGGTLDKLESIPGFETQLSARRTVQIVQRVGCAICGQTDRMVPADKKLYALRDATGTVPSIPLITASIMSKKLAENLDALILDVKFGRAAFMQTQAEARKLARAMVALGKQCGVNTRAILSDMNSPLGSAVGNWLEVKEAVALLEGGHIGGALRETVLSCAAHLLIQTRKARTWHHAYKQATACLNSGDALRKWVEMLRAQGGDLVAYRRKLARNHGAPFVMELKSTVGGYLASADARIIGKEVRDLGGGRLTKESAINHDVGVDRIRPIGEAIAVGDVLARIHATTRAAAEKAAVALPPAFVVCPRKPNLRPLVAGVVK